MNRPETAGRFPGMRVDDDAVQLAADLPAPPFGPEQRYLAGQPITTASGRAGTLTGAADDDGNPYAQFGSDDLYLVRRDQISGPLVHLFGDTREAYDFSQSRDAVHDGDVLLVPGDGVDAILYQAWPVAVNEPPDVQYGEFHGFPGGPDALAAKDGGRYADSVRVARQAITPRPRLDGNAAGSEHAGNRRGASRGPAAAGTDFPVASPLSPKTPGRPQRRGPTGRAAPRPEEPPSRGRPGNDRPPLWKRHDG